MRAIPILMSLFFLASNTLAENLTCQAIVKIPEGWISTLRNGINIYLPPDKTASLSIDCSILPRTFNDMEFSAHIGEEEPEEAPPLKKFGVFRGRIWIMKNNDLSWWLMKERFMVHLTLKSQNGAISSNIKEQVNKIVRNLVIKRQYN